jgi:hypothetical protein
MATVSKAAPSADKSASQQTPKKKPLLYRLYRQKPVEMRRFDPETGLGADVRGRLTPQQLATGSPKRGDMILRRNGIEELVTAEEFEATYEPSPVT